MLQQMDQTAIHYLKIHGGYQLTAQIRWTNDQQYMFGRLKKGKCTTMWVDPISIWTAESNRQHRISRAWDRTDEKSNLTAEISACTRSGTLTGSSSQTETRRYGTKPTPYSAREEEVVLLWKGCSFASVVVLIPFTRGDKRNREELTKYWYVIGPIWVGPSLSAIGLPEAGLYVLWALSEGKRIEWRRVSYFRRLIHFLDFLNKILNSPKLREILVRINLRMIHFIRQMVSMD